jgi:hypothetical protein
MNTVTGLRELHPLQYVFLLSILTLRTGNYCTWVPCTILPCQPTRLPSFEDMNKQRKKFIHYFTQTSNSKGANKLKIQYQSEEGKVCKKESVGEGRDFVCCAILQYVCRVRLGKVG